MQSRYLIWIDCQRIDVKGFIVKKQLIIPSLNLDTFIKFIIKRVGSEIMISLDDSTGSLLKGRNIKCKCLIYDAVNKSRASSEDNETTFSGYFGSFLEITLISGLNCNPFSAIAGKDCYEYDSSMDRINTEMSHEILLQIPLKSPIPYKKVLNGRFIRKPYELEIEPSLFSFVCGKYIFPKRFYDFLHENRLFYTNLVHKRVQYWFKNFDEKFELSHSPGSESVLGSPESYLLTIILRRNTNSIEVDDMNALQDLQKNQINYIEADRAAFIYGKLSVPKRRLSEPGHIRSCPMKKPIIRSLLPPKNIIRKKKERKSIPVIIRWRY